VLRRGDRIRNVARRSEEIRHLLQPVGDALITIELAPLSNRERLLRSKLLLEIGERHLRILLLLKHFERLVGFAREILVALSPRFDNADEDIAALAVEVRSGGPA